MIPLTRLNTAARTIKSQGMGQAMAAIDSDAMLRKNGQEMQGDFGLYFPL
jgi:hypothetical protein